MTCRSSEVAETSSVPPSSIRGQQDTRTTVSEVHAAPRTGSSGKASWRDILLAAADMDLWEGVRRENRPGWKDYLEKAEQLVRQPRKPLAKDVVESVLRGDFEELGKKQISCNQPRVVIFVSSTFTDTKAERNMLMRDVYPYLRLVCRTLGLDFGAVDMRWGVREETTKGHDTVNMCLQEVDRCKAESAGPAFLGILADKYGYRPPPSEIPQTEMDTIFSTLGEQSEESAFLREYYRLDTNAIPPEYDLLARSDENKDWWSTEERIQKILRKAAAALDAETAEKYFISVTEKELVRGVFENAARNQQVVLIERSLSRLRDRCHQHRHMIDMQGEDIDEDAQQHLQQLRAQKFPEKASDLTDVHLKFEYPADEKSCHENIKDVCDSVCKQLLESIMGSYSENLHVEQDELFQEIVHHGYFLLDKSRVFVGRDDLIQRIVSYCNSEVEEGQSILGIHGQSGCGKTALLAVACQRTQRLHADGVTVIRFLGTTANSGSARAVLYSVCSQIVRAYGGDPSTIPTSYRDLIPHLRKCMMMATAAKPLYIFLDSLDQLSNEDMGHNLKWLSLHERLPANVHLVVSTLPNQCLDMLRSHLAANQLVEVTPLDLQDGPLILNKMLAARNRCVTPQQEAVILQAFKQCPLPLFLRLTADMALRWHSYDDVSADDLSTDMPGLVTKLFAYLEARYGELFVSRALAYITAAKNGLSVAELEDVISCDDEVLDEIFAFWIPPLRRVPQLLWIRIRNDLGMYLVERGTDGTTAYSWYHRQFWETAERKYLGRPEHRTHAHRALADYFEGKYAAGKYYVPTSKKDTNQEARIEDRKVPTQPLVLYGDRRVGKVYNRRQITELPYHLAQLDDAAAIEKLLLSLEYLEAKLACGKGYDLQSELRDATTRLKGEALKKITKFIDEKMFTSQNNYWDQFFSDDMSSTDSGVDFKLKNPSNAPLAQRRMVTRGPEVSGQVQPPQQHQPQQQQPQQQPQQQQHQQLQPYPQNSSEAIPRGVTSGRMAGSPSPVENAGFYSENKENVPEHNPYGQDNADVDDRTIILEGDDFPEGDRTSTPLQNRIREKVFLHRPDVAFKGHDVESDGIGVFYDESGDLVMEVGIDRILRFTYRYGEEIDGYRCVPTVGGPADHHVTISLQRWAKLRDSAAHISTQVEEIFGGNGVQSRLHLGGLYFVQISKRFSNVQIRQYSLPNSGQKLFATKFGISMSIPEYAYFSNLLEAFCSRIQKLETLVPCYRRPHHSDMCVECYPLKKHSRRIERRAGSSNGGGGQFMGVPEKRKNTSMLPPPSAKWPRVVKQEPDTGSGLHNKGFFCDN